MSFRYLSKLTKAPLIINNIQHIRPNLPPWSAPKRMVNPSVSEVFPRIPPRLFQPYAVQPLSLGEGGYGGLQPEEVAHIVSELQSGDVRSARRGQLLGLLGFREGEVQAGVWEGVTKVEHLGGGEQEDDEGEVKKGEEESDNEQRSDVTEVGGGAGKSVRAVSEDGKRGQEMVDDGRQIRSRPSRRE